MSESGQPDQERSVTENSPDIISTKHEVALGNSPHQTYPKHKITYFLFLFWNFPFNKVTIPALAASCSIMNEYVSYMIMFGLPLILSIGLIISVCKLKNLHFWSIAAYCEYTRESKAFKCTWFILYVYLGVSLYIWADANYIHANSSPLQGQTGNKWSIALALFTIISATFDYLGYNGAYHLNGVPKNIKEAEIFEYICNNYDVPVLYKIRISTMEYSWWSYLLILPALNKLLFWAIKEEHFAWWTDSQDMFVQIRTLLGLRKIYPKLSINELSNLDQFSDIDWTMVQDLNEEDFKALETYFFIQEEGETA